MHKDTLSVAEIEGRLAAVRIVLMAVRIIVANKRLVLGECTDGHEESCGNQAE